MLTCVRFADLASPLADGCAMPMELAIGADGVWHTFWTSPGPRGQVKHLCSIAFNFSDPASRSGKSGLSFSTRESWSSKDLGHGPAVAELVDQSAGAPMRWRWRTYAPSSLTR